MLGGGQCGSPAPGAACRLGELERRLREYHPLVYEVAELRLLGANQKARCRAHHDALSAVAARLGAPLPCCDPAAAPPRPGPATCDAYEGAEATGAECLARVDELLAREIAGDGMHAQALRRQDSARPLAEVYLGDDRNLAEKAVLLVPASESRQTWVVFQHRDILVRAGAAWRARRVWRP